MLIGMLIVIVFLIAVTVTLICYLASGPDSPPTQAAVFTPQQAAPAPQQSVPASTPVISNPMLDASTPGIHGRVLSPDGSPVSGATVLLVPSGRTGLRIRNGKVFYEERGGLPVPRTSTDAQGRYGLPQQNGTFAVVAIADTGLARLNQDDVAKSADLTLTKWGRIAGQFMIGSKPGAHVRLRAGAMVPSSERDQVIVSIANFAQTDAQGEFSMEGVQPGTNLIARDYEQASSANTMTYTADIQTVEVAAGTTTAVTVGGGGRAVTGKFVFNKSLNPADYFINARAYPLARGDDVAVYFLQPDRNKNFRIDNVPPGDYRIHINLDSMNLDRKSEPDQPRFTVPDDNATDPIVIPDIQLN
jgi:hypothetical protein